MLDEGAGFRFEEIVEGESFVSVFVYHEKAVGYHLRRRIDYQIIVNKSFGEEGMVSDGMTCWTQSPNCLQAGSFYSWKMPP